MIRFHFTPACLTRRHSALRQLLLFAAALLLSGGLGAHEASARTIHVAPTAKGDGSRPNAALPRLDDAMAKAKPGDTIILAPGVYHERVRVGVRGLRIQGSYSEDNIPQVTIVAPTKTYGPLLVDSQNTRWSGVAFQSGEGPVAELRGFEGRFEHCLFDLRGNMTTLNIEGGSPSFHACTFANQSGPDTAIVFGESKKPNAAARFSYCLFRDIEGGAYLLRGNQKIRIINCVFANLKFIGMRIPGNEADVSVVNSVFYLTLASRLFLQEPFDRRVIVENSIYAPAPGRFMVWNCSDLDRQPEVISIKNRTVSPRFAGGRHALLNLCIDDTGNYALWLSLVPYAKKLGLSITLALNTDELTPEIWKSIVPANNEGFELASHGAAHSSLIARDVLRLGWSAENSHSATVDIDKDKNLTIRVDGKPAYVRALDAKPNITMGELVKDLEEKGFRAQLVDLSNRKLPARLLQSVTGQDIFFASYEPVFILDTGAYQRWMLGESREKLEAAFKTYHTKQQSNAVIVAPYSENGPSIISAMDATGYVLARSGFEDVDYVSPLKEVNLYFLRSVSLGKLFATMPVDDRSRMFRIYLDYLKYHGAIMGVYAHGGKEVSAKDWIDIFDVLADVPLVETMPMARIAHIVQTQCTPTGKGTYRCDGKNSPLSGSISFKPQQDSPLLGAGIPTECTTNFTGAALPQGQAPNIGIY